MKIYIVQASGGEWDDSWTSNVRAFCTKEKAEEYVRECEKNVPEYSEYFSRLIERISTIAEFYASLQQPCDDITYFVECGRVYNSLVEKAHKKYPRYTEHRDEANVWYRIDEVEMDEC